MCVIYIPEKQTGKRPFCQLLPYLWLVLISACGGGGSKSENNTSPAPVENIVIEQEQSQDPIAELQNLIIADDFSFTSKEQVTFTVSHEGYRDQRAYVSLYSDYRQLPSGEYYPISDSRVLAGNLQQGEFTQTFTHLKQEQHYLAEIWLYDLSTPLQKELTLNGSNLNW